MLLALKKGDTRVPLTNAPRLAHGTAKLSAIRTQRDGADAIVRADYSGNLHEVTWRLAPSGALAVSYAFPFGHN